MGLLTSLFGGGSSSGDGEKKDHAVPRNEGERSAARDYVKENLDTGKDPIPRDSPSWAKDIPTPNK